MFWNIFTFELKYRLKRPATYLYGLILFLYTFLVLIYGNGPASEKANVNSPYAISYLLILTSIFATMLSSAVMGVPVYRDIEHNTRTYFFSYPISERGYLMGRYLGSFVVLIGILSCACFGIMLGSALGPVLNLADNVERYGPIRIWDYVQPLLVFVIPTVFFTGSLFFSLVALTRNVFVTYAGSLLLFIGYLLGLTLATDLENKDLVDLLDPFALNTFENATKYWTPAEQNELHAGLTGNVLLNRLLWGGIGLATLLYTLFRFDFQRFLAVRLGKKSKPEAVTPKAPPLTTLPVAEKTFTTNAYFGHLLRLTRLEFANIVRDVYFLVILMGGALFLFLDGWFADQIMGTRSLPATYYMIEAKDFNYILFVFILIIFYTGESVHRDKAVRFDNIADALPIPNWVSYGSKFLALAGICFLLVNLVIVSGVLNQLLKGYFHFEFGQYFTDLYLIEFPEYLQLLMLAFFVHILVNSKFTGHIITIGVWVILFGLRNFAELDYNLFFYSYSPGYRISDMNGFGHFLKPLFWFNLYWLAFGLALLVIGNLFWNRGSEGDLKTRWQLAKLRFSKPSAAALTVFLLTWVASGAWIYYNVSVLNQYQTPDEVRELQAEYEKKYSRYERTDHPKITDVQVRIDLVPEERRVTANGLFTLVNKTAHPLDSLHLLFAFPPAFHAKAQKLLIDGKPPKALLRDTVFRYHIYQLPRTLQPGDTARMEITMVAQPKGFTNSGLNRHLVYNGSFFDTSIFPSFGYSTQGELSSDKYRKKFSLPIKQYQQPAYTDTWGRSNFLFTQDGDWITFEGTVSTAPDQLAIMPGYLQKEWTANGRKYYHYKMDAPIAYFMNVSSARYAVQRDVWKSPDGKPVNIEVYYHPTHGRNIDRYVNSVKASMDYYHQHFSPYQFRQMRIMEFPRYESFAQSFPNTVPYAESFGWVGDFRDPDKTDYAYYVTAHEVAHQWWGHQVMPSNTRGANQISESMAEYASLMVLKHTYGDNIMQSRLKYSLDRYLRGRSSEDKFEETLLDNDTRAYVWYDKGSVVLFALQDYIGEKRLNRAFRDYLQRDAFQQKSPFTTSRDWYSYIKAATPDSLQYYLTDSFEKIALYENRITDAKTVALKNDQYKVTMTVQTRKLYYDKAGKETGAGKAKDLIEIGIFAADAKNKKGMTEKVPLYLKKHWLAPGTHTLEFVVKGKPAKAGIDPYNKLIDRVSDDNVKPVE
ncbi:ABC transporter permease/M1 family aminopeptidase [Larkinella sp. VNQ87]|uniref:ABC transporter permease/M1 family aminopeptidase n=1 Tax=Larkinella sp. VNQ87 TaxID=3400921 RepID=UPI003BFEE351